MLTVSLTVKSFFPFWMPRTSKTDEFSEKFQRGLTVKRRFFLTTSLSLPAIVTGNCWRAARQISGLGDQAICTLCAQSIEVKVRKENVFCLSEKL